MKKEKAGIVIGIAAAVALCGLGIGFREQIISVFSGENNSEERVYVEQISNMNTVISGMSSRFNGVVETQDVFELKADSSRKISEIHVAVGDIVEEGQILVTYDVSELKLQIEQADLEVESIKNDIANERKQIELLTQQMASLPAEAQFTYSAEIQNINNSISQKEYDLKSKQLEIDKLKTQINNSTVKSEAAGTVKSVNESGVDEMGNTAPLISILQSGDYRIKGRIDEQNVWSITEGQTVIIRSRVEENQTWTGTITKIDTENPEQNNNNNYGEEQGIQASKYPFYIELDSSDGLILGQHVYIDFGEGETEEKEGVWLYSYYIVQEEDTAYVWAANKKDRLEKRIVELGEYDAELDQYQIVSGLTEDDYIAWPMEGLYEGVAVVTNIEDENWNYEENNDNDVYDEFHTSEEYDESLEGTEWY